MADTPKKTLGLEQGEPAVTPPPAELEPAIEKKPVSPGTTRKREIPQGLWTKCPECEEMIFDKEKLLSVYDMTKDAEPMKSKSLGGTL